MAKCACTKERQALREFVDAIEATGGVKQDNHGYTVPVADEDWIDLGAAYVQARAALRSLRIRSQKRRR